MGPSIWRSRIRVMACLTRRSFTLPLQEAAMLCIGSLCLSVGRLAFNSTSTGKLILFARRTNLVREALRAKFGRMLLMFHITTQQELGECEQHEGVFVFVRDVSTSIIHGALKKSGARQMLRLQLSCMWFLERVQPRGVARN